MSEVVAAEETQGEDKAQVKQAAVTFRPPDIWTLEHYDRFQNAKQASKDDGLLGNFAGCVELIKAQFVRIECDDADVKARVLKLLTTDDRRTVSTSIIGYVVRAVWWPLNESLTTDPNW